MAFPKGNNEINALMYSIASTDAGFVNAGTDENAITKVFSDIATDIQYKAHDVTLTDTMGAGFTYLSNETYPSNPVVTPSADNKTVTWNVADKLGDETKTLTFYVQYDKRYSDGRCNPSDQHERKPELQGQQGQRADSYYS